MFLAAGTYTISGGDITGLSIYRQDGETGDVVIIVDPSVDGTDSATLGANVEYQNSLTVTLVGADSTDGRLDFFPASLGLDDFHNVTGSALDSDICRAPAGALQISGSGPTFTAGQFNNWLNTFIRGQSQYNALVRDHGTDLDGSNAIDSLGSTNPASVNGTYVKFTPSGNADITVGYVQDNSSGEVGVTTPRTVMATIDGESESVEFNFNVVIGEETAFDTQTTGNTLARFVSDDLDDRYLTAETVGNLGLGVPAYDGTDLVTTVTT